MKTILLLLLLSSATDAAPRYTDETCHLYIDANAEGDSYGYSYSPQSYYDGNLNLNAQPKLVIHVSQDDKIQTIYAYPKGFKNFDFPCDKEVKVTWYMKGNANTTYYIGIKSSDEKTSKSFVKNLNQLTEENGSYAFTPKAKN